MGFIVFLGFIGFFLILFFNDIYINMNFFGEKSLQIKILDYGQKLIFKIEKDHCK